MSEIKLNKVEVAQIVIAKETREVVAQAEADIANASRFSITTPAEYEHAGEFLKVIKGRYNQLETMRKQMTSPLDESKRRIMGFFRQPLEQLSNAEKEIKGGIVAFDHKLKEDQEKEAIRLQAIAEKEQRLLNSRAEKQATKAETKGETEKAEDIRVSVPVVTIPTATFDRPRVAGVKTSVIWRHRVTDDRLLPREFLTVDERKLSQFARESKGSIPVPGVEFYPETVVASTRE